MPDEALQSEPVHFQIRGVGHCSQQVDMQIMDAVGGHGQVVGLGEVCNLHPGGDAADTGDIRLGLVNSNVFGVESWISYLLSRT